MTSYDEIKDTQPTVPVTVTSNVPTAIIGGGMPATPAVTYTPTTSQPTKQPQHGGDFYSSFRGASESPLSKKLSTVLFMVSVAVVLVGITVTYAGATGVTTVDWVSFAAITTPFVLYAISMTPGGSQHRRWIMIVVPLVSVASTVWCFWNFIAWAKLAKTYRGSARAAAAGLFFTFVAEAIVSVLAFMANISSASSEL